MTQADFRKTPKPRQISDALRAKQWRPGQSGNPGGRSKQMMEAVALARQNVVAGVQRLIELMQSPDDRVALFAVNSLLDRGLGKAKELPDEPAARQRLNLKGLSDEDIATLRRIFAKAAADQPMRPPEDEEQGGEVSERPAGEVIDAEYVVMPAAPTPGR